MAKILVVDDDPAMQPAIQRERAGHVAILDIRMPGADRLTTMDPILTRTPDHPITVPSGCSHTPRSISEPDYLTMATKLGAVSALPEPFKTATLLTMVSNCLASTGKQAAPPGPGYDAIPKS